MTPQQRDDLDALAGEYVLGLLSADEMKRVELRLADDIDLRGAVAFWQDRLQPLASLPVPIEPAPELWRRIETALPRTSQPQRSAARTGLWDSLAFWRWATVTATAATLVLALITLLRPATEVSYVAVLQAPDRTAGWIVQATASQPVRLAPLLKIDVAAGKSLQFWTLYDRAQGPVSLGLVTAQDRTLVFPPDKLPGLKEGQLFEITLEPYGGSPVGRPTGAVLFKGLTVRTG